VRGAKLINGRNQRRGGSSRPFVLKLLRVFQKGSESKGGDLECSRCWCGIVLESTRAGWRDDSSGISDSSADCGLAVPPRKFNQN
jgi:hypothetical protein